MFRTTTTLSALALLASAASAATFFELGSDQEFADQFGGIGEIFVAEARNVSSDPQEIASDWEIGFGESTASPALFTQRDTVWTDRRTYEFTLTNDVDTDTMTFDIRDVQTNALVADTITRNIRTTGLEYIFIRIAGLDDSNSARVSFPRIQTDAGEFAVASNLTSFGGASYFGIEGDDLEGDFILTGLLFFTFDDNTVGSRPSVQIKGIPTPGAAMLAGLAGLGVTRRRRA